MMSLLNIQTWNNGTHTTGTHSRMLTGKGTATIKKKSYLLRNDSE
jgi:hypothetical protein